MTWHDSSQQGPWAAVKTGNRMRPISGACAEHEQREPYGWLMEVELPGPADGREEMGNQDGLYFSLSDWERGTRWDGVFVGKQEESRALFWIH
jgi:hypothetical protein